MFRPKIIFVLVVLMMVTLLPTKASVAQSTVGPGVDLIILIDQSGSMSRDEPITDPDKVRVSIAQYLMEYLYFDGAYVNADRVNRVTVIGFGSPNQTHSMVNLTPLESAADVGHAQAGIAAEDLGATSFIAALRLVREQFPPATDVELRQRIIVLITDGGPADERNMSYGEYFDEIKGYYDTHLGSERFPLYVINVDKGDRAGRLRYWNEVARDWKTIAGDTNVILVRQIEETNREIVKVLCPRLNPNQPPEYCAVASLGPHFVQPYARMVQFSFFKYDPKAQARLYRPGEYPNTRIKPSDPDVKYEATQTDGNTRDEIYRISNPSVGCWITDREGTGQVDVFVQVAFHKIDIASPLSAHPQIQPLTIKLELLDDQKQPVDELPDYPIKLETELIDKDGDKIPLQMQRVGAGQYATVSPLMLTKTGTYTLTTEGYTTVATSPLVNCITSTQNIPIFQRQTFQIFVSRPTLTVFEPDQPLLRYGPITGLVLGFTDSNGNPITDTQNAPWTMQVSAKSPSGRITDLPTPRWDNGHFRIVDPFFLPENGTYTLTARLVGQDGAQLAEYQTSFTTAENINVLMPGACYPASAPVEAIDIELRDDKGQPIAVNPNYPLNLIAEIARPDGQLEQVVLARASEPGRYRSPVKWSFQKGIHVLTLTGKTRLLPGEKEQDAFVARREIDISGSLPYFRVVSPDETQGNASYALHNWFIPPLPFALRSMPIRVELLSDTQQAKASDFFITNPNELFTLEIEGQAIQSTTLKLPKIVDAEQYGVNLSQLTEPGLYTATVRLAGAVQGNVCTEGAWPPRTVVFRLSDSPLYPIVWWGSIGLASAAMLAAIGWQLLNRVILPPARGKLILEKVRGGEICTIDLKDWSRNRFTVKGAKLGNLSQLREIRVKRSAPLQESGPITVEGVEIVAYTKKGEEVRSTTLYAKSSRNILKNPVLKTQEDKPIPYQIRYEN